MGRCFSTAYRSFLLAASISAVVLSILSATSCSYLTFDHQYKGSGRFLFGFDAVRNLQDPTEGGDETMEDPMDLGGDPMAGVTPEDPADDPALTFEPPADEPAEAPVDEPAMDTPPDEVTAPDLAAAAEAAAAAAAEAPVDDEPVDEPVPVAAPASDEPVPVSTPVVDDPTPVATPALDEPVPVTTPALDDPTPVSTPAVDEPAAVDPMASAPALDETTTEATASFWGEEPEDETPLGEPMSGQGSSEPDEDATGAFGSPEDESTFGGSSGYGETAPASEQVPIAQASGDAGLFCEGEQTFKVTNLWKGSIDDLEAAIDAESQGNQSEELARGAALAATVFGMLAAVILILEMMMGFRLCLERWIVGLISLVACISQGITFLFFNSERYCDGDIVHEILNQEPCVMGQGAVFSLVALILYAIMWILACRLPKDDPYGLCCNNKDSATSTQDGSSGQFGLLGGKTESLDTNGNGNTARSGQERERPNWMSEENGVNDEENEII